MHYLRPLRFLKHTLRNFSTKNVISSKAKHLQIPKITLQEFLWKNLDKWPDKTATVCFDTNRSYTYNQLYKKSLSITNFLKDSLKLKKQETVAIILPNIPEYPIIVLGAIQAGLRVTTCNPNYTVDEIKKQLLISQSRLVFTSSDLLPVVRQATTIPVVEVASNNQFASGTISFDEISTENGGLTTISDVSVDEVIFLPFSSGTTGVPKGVQLSHYNIVSNLCQITSPEFGVVHQRDDEQDNVPGFLPFFHIYGLVVVMLQTLAQGAKLITMHNFSSDNFVKLLENHKPDVIFGVPQVVIMANNNPNIKSKDLLGIRTLLSGAAPLGATDVERFHRKTNNKVCILQGYGMTETSPVTHLQTEKLENGLTLGGSGFLVPNTQAKIISLDGSSSDGLGPGKTGELVMKGPQVMSGYFNNDQANEEIFMEDGWLKTGDIAHYDEHDHFYVTDRCKDLIKVKGFQVAPAEIEEILRSHPSVDDAGVTGVTHSILGEAPKAFVVVKSGHSVKPSDLEEFVSTKVAKHKQLAGGVVLVEAIPKNPSGKILRRELRKM